MVYLKENWRFLIFIVLMCIIGGYFTTIYSINSIDPNMLADAIKQVGSKEVLIIVSTLQIALYAAIFGAIGIILSNKMGLWKKFETNKTALLGVIIISIVGGIILSIGDKYIFGSFIDSIYHSYDSKPTLEYLITSFTYGGVFEEILMRLFLMSLISWCLYKIFYRKEKEVPTKVFVIANVVSAILFAAGHIPATMLTFGSLDAIILIRCFLLNGTFGMAFGWLYRKYGIGYAMLAHFGAHLISKFIWLLFM